MNKQAMLVVFQNTQLYLAEIYQKDLWDKPQNFPESFHNSPRFT